MLSMKHSNASARLMKQAAIVLLALIPFTASAQRRERLIDNWKPLHYDVNITLNDQLTEIQHAQTTIEGLVLKNVSSIDLDFGSLAIDSITIGSNSAHFDRKSGTLDVNLGRTANAGDKFSIVV